MAKTKWWIASLLTMALGATQAQAQAPGGGLAGGGAAAAAPPAAAAAGAAAPAAAAAPGFFKKCCMALEECKRKLCKTPAGQMLNSMTMPLSAATGGIIPSFCPAMPSAADLLKSGVDGAAANAKKDALEAKERVKAVRYLGTLDCRYYPEAEIALIAALRMDRIECVRWEAALVLGRGCCCTKKVMDALEICVSGSERDGSPAERSERVREAAFFALNHCVACYREAPVEVQQGEGMEKKPKEGEGMKTGTNMTAADRELIERARRTASMFESHRVGSMPATAAAQRSVLGSGQRSLYHVIRFGTDGGGQPAQPTQQVARAPQPLPQQTAPPPRAWAPEIPNTPRQLPPMQNTTAQQPQPRIQQSMPMERVEPIVQVPDVQPMEQPAPRIQRPMEPTRPYAQRPMPVERTEPVAQTPVEKVVEKPAPEKLMIEPMDPTPRPESQEVRPANRVEAPQVPVNTVVTPVQQPPATIEKPVVDEKTVGTLVDNMLTASTPMERHQAIRGVINLDWHKHPQIVAALVKAARLDSDRAVRVSAIRHMVAMKIDMNYVMEHLKYMQNDQDDWVKQESTDALAKLAK